MDLLDKLLPWRRKAKAEAEMAEMAERAERAANDKASEEADRTAAQLWAAEAVRQRDFGSLAATCVTCTSETWYRFYAAKSALHEAGPAAVDAIVAQLEAEFSTYLTDLTLKSLQRRSGHHPPPARSQRALHE
jgi:hypothetical protein